MSQNSFTNRTITKTNFLLQKFGSNPKKYPKWNLYKRWIKERNPPPFPFKLKETLLPGGSALHIGGIILQIRTSKRLKSTNHYGVLEVKDFLKKILTANDVSLDDLASFIAVYSNNIPIEFEEKNVNNKDINNYANNTTTNKLDNHIQIDDNDVKVDVEQIIKKKEIILNNDDIDDWEDIEL